MGIFDRIASNLGGEAAGVAPVDQRDALQMGLLVSGLQALAGAGTQGIDAVPQGLLSGLEAFRGTLGQAQQRDRRDELVDLDRRRVEAFEQRAKREQLLLEEASQNRERVSRELARRLAVDRDYAAQLKEGFVTGPFSDNVEMQGEVEAMEFAIVRAGGHPTEKDLEAIAGHASNFIELSGEAQDGLEKPVPKEIELASSIGRTMGPEAQARYEARLLRGGNSDNDLLVAALSGQDPEAREWLLLKRSLEAEEEGGRTPEEHLARVDANIDSIMSRQNQGKGIMAFPPDMRTDIHLRRIERGLRFPNPDLDELRLESAGMEVILSQIDAYSQAVNTKEGFSAITSGNIRNFASLFNLDPEITLYKDAISSFRSFLARGLGHSGVLTAQDVADAMAITPRITESKEIRDLKMGAVRGIFNAMKSKREAILMGLPDETLAAATEQDTEILDILNAYRKRAGAEGSATGPIEGADDPAMADFMRRVEALRGNP